MLPSHFTGETIPSRLISSLLAAAPMDKLKTKEVTKKPKQPPQQQQKKKKQIKVVYISNPMHFKASASEFKGLVQQFTGQDSDVAELSRLAGGMDQYEEPSISSDKISFSAEDLQDSASQRRLQQQEEEAQEQQQREAYRCAAAPFDAFEEVFTPQVLENIFMPSSSLYYEPHPPVMY